MANPKFIALHDWRTGAVEYAEITEIARIEPEMLDIHETVEVTRRSWFGNETKVKEVQFKEERLGSRIYMKHKGHTCVAETPSEVIQLIKQAQGE